MHLYSKNVVRMGLFWSKSLQQLHGCYSTNSESTSWLRKELIPWSRHYSHVYGVNQYCSSLWHPQKKSKDWGCSEEAASQPSRSQEFPLWSLAAGNCLSYLQNDQEIRRRGIRIEISGGTPFGSTIAAKASTTKSKLYNGVPFSLLTQSAKQFKDSTRKLLNSFNSQVGIVKSFELKNVVCRNLNKKVCAYFPTVVRMTVLTLSRFMNGKLNGLILEVQRLKAKLYIMTKVNLFRGLSRSHLTQ